MAENSNRSKRFNFAFARPGNAGNIRAFRFAFTGEMPFI